MKSKKLRIAVYTIATIILSFVLFCASVYFEMWGPLPTSKELTELKQAEATQILDTNQKLIGKYFIFDRQPIKFNDIPPYLIDALIATEDARFYEHNGIDIRSLGRVFFKSILLRDKSSGGGSTITTQLVKNIFGRKDYGFFSMPVNKVREAIIAGRIENIYYKKEILTLYLNTVPFSGNTYGVESASQKFFGKTTSSLTLSEAATLIGTLKASHSYNPRLFPEKSQLRRDVVIKQMEKYGYLTPEETNKCINEKLELNFHAFEHDEGIAPYFREHVKKELQEILKTITKADGSKYDIYKDGLKVYTTLDSKMQVLAEEAMKKNMKKLQASFEKSHVKNPPWKKTKNIIGTLKRTPRYIYLKKKGYSEKQINDSLTVKNDTELFDWTKTIVKNVSITDSIQHYKKFLNTGLLSIDPKTGAIRAYIGGINYKYFKYDHVSQSKRQIGSTFKPILYTAAIENGMDPCTYFPLRKITYTNLQGWTPKNSAKLDMVDKHLNYSLKKALSNSINTIAVKVLEETGINTVLSMATKMGFDRANLPKVPSLALGVAEVPLEKVAGVYASYVNDGKPQTPYSITKIEDKDGKILAEFKPKNNAKPAFSSFTNQVLIEMMKETVNTGTAKRLRTTYKLKNDIAGKTGTTQRNRDGWFVAITPKLVTVTWVGNSDYQIGFKTTSMGQGANTALPIFASLYQKMNADKDFNHITNARFPSPPAEVIESLDCKPEKRDGFFKRLFGRKKKEKEFGKK